MIVCLMVGRSSALSYNARAKMVVPNNSRCKITNAVAVCIAGRGNFITTCAPPMPRAERQILGVGGRAKPEKSRKVVAALNADAAINQTTNKHQIELQMMCDLM